jgi:hypothetical protein
MAPASEKSYGEVGVLLANDYGGPKIFHKLPDVMGEGYGEKARQQKNMAVGFF